ncbi:hypothetical protein [Leptolyngbya sp. CCY15150]|uniref:hypothetical protein n=1 Tax=Leptolyngbya sp. CCY15150 TaxID=2767772 RepID=UPI0019524EA1|nr:hypothetical protein [Leptolyngbya sp. CCY15150]
MQRLTIIKNLIGCLLLALALGGQPALSEEISPAPVADPAPEAIAPEPAESSDPLQKYLTVLPHAVQTLDLQPGVVKMVVTSEAGHTTLRCGDRIQTYTCAPGRAIAIERDPSEAMMEFRAQNDSDQPVRLKLRIEQLLSSPAV